MWPPFEIVCRVFFYFLLEIFVTFSSSDSHQSVVAMAVAMDDKNNDCYCSCLCFNYGHCQCATNFIMCTRSWTFTSRRPATHTLYALKIILIILNERTRSQLL